MTRRLSPRRSAAPSRLPHRMMCGIVMALVAITPSAPATALDATVTSPLDRAAFTTLPSVYRLTVHIRIDRIEVGTRRLPVNRTVTFQGTAFGVGPKVAVTAKHVVRPLTPALVNAAADAGITQARDLDPSGARVVSRPIRMTLTRAQGGTVTGPETIVTRYLAGTKGPADLALLATGTTIAPALELQDAPSSGTPVALIGFGPTTAATPTVRTGQLGLAAQVEGSDDDSLVTVRDLAAQRGDSGAPIVDDQGRVRGVLIRRAVAPGEDAVMSRAGAVRRLMESADHALGPSEPQVAYARGMQAYWNYDYDAAARDLTRANDLIPQATWIADLATTSSRLADARYRVVQHAPWRVPLIAMGLLFLGVATAFALRFWAINPDGP